MSSVEVVVGRYLNSARVCNIRLYSPNTHWHTHNMRYILFNINHLRLRRRAYNTAVRVNELRNIVLPPPAWLFDNNHGRPNYCSPTDPTVHHRQINNNIMLCIIYLYRYTYTPDDSGIRPVGFSIICEYTLTHKHTTHKLSVNTL